VLRTKCVRSPMERKKDGLRILATRFRGRGLPSSRYDVWMPSLAPSERLLREAQAGRVTPAQFAERYRKELFQSADVDRRNATVKNHGQKFTLRLLKRLAKRGNVTLMCHCAEDERRCHRHILKALIESRRI